MTFRKSVRWPIPWKGFGHPSSVTLRGGQAADPQKLLAHQAGAQDKVVPVSVHRIPGELRQGHSTVVPPLLFRLGVGGAKAI